jgi:ferredoxin
MGIDFTEKGRPSVDRQTCSQCGECVEICPERILVLDRDYARAGHGGFMGCIACGHCTAICPTGAITVSGRGLQADDQVELPPPGARAGADQLEALLLGRRSIRRFTEKPVDRAALERIVEMAATAPMGIPPHEVGVVVFDSPEKVQRFADDACEAFRRTVRFFNPVVLTLMRPLLGKKLCRLMRDFVKPLFRTILERRAEGEDAFTYHAPAVMLFHHTPLADAADCVIVATYAMLAAESLGLGSCMLGTATAVGHFKDVKQKAGIPADHQTGVGLAIGHPAVEFQRGVRRRLHSVRFA